VAACAAVAVSPKRAAMTSKVLATVTQLFLNDAKPFNESPIPSAVAVAPWSRLLKSHGTRSRPVSLRPWSM
jgi:hypothetical protein